MDWNRERQLGCGLLTQQQLHPHPLPLFLYHSPMLSLSDQTGQNTYYTGFFPPYPPISPPSCSPQPQVSQTLHHLSLICVFSADIRCHSCYKVPVLGCVDRTSCRLEQGQKCLTTNVYLGNLPFFSLNQGQVGDSMAEAEAQLGLRLSKNRE